MKSCTILFFSCLYASIACGQQSRPAKAPAQAVKAPSNPSAAPQTAAAPTPGTSSSGLKARGPEAVSQQDPNRVVATIGGKQITAKQAMDLLKPIQPQDRKRYESNLGALLQQIYAENQIAGEATK